MIRRALASISLAAVMAVGLAACGGGGSGSGGASTYPGKGNADAGKTLFVGAGGCAVCHTIAGTSAQAKIGPELTHVGSMISADQIYTQIVDPQVRPAPYAQPPTGTHMTPNNLTDQQRQDLTAYLSTLK